MEKNALKGWNKKSIIDFGVKICILAFLIVTFFNTLFCELKINADINRLILFVLIIVIIAFICVYYFRYIYKWLLIIGAMSGVTLGICIFRNIEAAYAHLVRGISPISEAYYSAYKKYNNISNSNYILDYSDLKTIGINKYLSLKEITNVKDNWEFWVIVTLVIFVISITFVLITKKEKGFFVVTLFMVIPIALTCTVGAFPSTENCLFIIGGVMVYRLYFVFKKHGNVIGSVVAGGIVLTVLMCLAFGMRPYIKENKKINELKYIEVKSSIQNFQLKELPTQILSFFGGPFRNDKIVLNGNLNNSSERTITGTKMLKVTLTQMPEGTFYIKNFVGETYKNNKWSEFSLSDLEKDSSGYRLMKEADNRKRIYGETYNRINHSRVPAALQIATLDVFTECKNIAFVPYYAKVTDDDTVNGHGNLNFISGENSKTYQKYNYFPMEDAMALDEMDYGSDFEDWKIYENKVAKIVDEQIPDKLSKIREYKSKIYSDNIDDVSSNIDKLFSNGFKYTLMPGKTPSGQDVSEYFLTESRKGFCVHFATTATLMYRMCGIPARYVEGFAIPSSAFERDKNGHYTAVVTDKMAHAWTEVLNSYIGWVVKDHTIADTSLTEAESVNSPEEKENENVTNKIVEATTLQKQVNETQSNEKKNTDLENSNESDTKNSDNTNINGNRKVMVGIVLLVIIAVVILFVEFNALKKKKLRKCRNMSAVEAYIYLYCVGRRMCAGKNNLKRKTLSGANPINVKARSLNKGNREESNINKKNNLNKQTIEYDEFEYIMNELDIVNKEEWNWLYKKALEEKFSDKKIESEDEKKAYFIYINFRNKLIKKMKKDNRYGKLIWLRIKGM